LTAASIPRIAASRPPMRCAVGGSWKWILIVFAQ
jgi:hypothetical protein